MKLDTRSLRFRMWAYFILFSCIIMVSLWLLQIVFLNRFYEGMKADSMSDIAGEIMGYYGREDFADQVERISAQNFIQVFVTDTEGKFVYYADEHGSGGQKPFFNMPPIPDVDVPPRQLPINYDDFLRRLGDNSYVSYTINNGGNGRNTLVYGARMNDQVLYISMPLNPVDSTIEVLRRQLLYVTVIAILLGLVIAYFIARKLARPISMMTESAGELATGNYDVRFPDGYYTEIDALAHTLNYAAAELSKVENLRRELVANISHDFRTPLTMIKAYAELIKDVSGDDPQKRGQQLDIILQQSERLGRLVDDVLDLSLLQSGSEELHMENTDLSAIAEDTLKAFQPVFAKEGYTLGGSIDPDQYAYADATRMEQVLYNLVSNAIGHAGEGKRVWLNVMDKGGRVRCEVADNGQGIPKEDQPYIWERYYTSSERSNGKSSGLGLSIVKNILEQHGAAFGVESEPGEGSVFWFELNK